MERTGDTLGSKKVLVLSEYRFSQLILKPTDMIISITSPGMEHPRPDTGDIPRLNLHFHDVIEEELIGTELWRTIDPSQAELIIDFVDDNIEKSECLIVHCQAGMSRSPGVAIGLSRYYQFSNENELRSQFPHFNITVMKEIHKAWRKKHYQKSTTSTY